MPLRGWLRQRRPWRKSPISERGAAMIAVVVVVAVMAVTTADFAFNSTMDLAAAANARDDLRAHYLSRSGVALAQLLFRVQQRVIDPNRKMLGGMDLQIADYAPILMSAFNSAEGAQMLGSLFGVEGEIKGLGQEVGSFDLQMESLDGKLNLNCGGGANPSSPGVVRLASAVSAMMLPPRFNPLFEHPDEKGQYIDRLQVLQGIIDWADQDTVMFGGTAVEDYRYNEGKDPYEIKNQYYDTVDELYLIRGVDDEFMDAFRNTFTVYGTCKVNVNLADVPLITALILTFVQNPQDPALDWGNVALLARYVVNLRDFFGGFKDFGQFTRAIQYPMGEAMSAFTMGMQSLSKDQQGNQQLQLPMAKGVLIKEEALKEAVEVGGPRRIWYITASAEVGRIKKKIKAIWDMQHISMQSSKVNMGPGGFLYWREE